LNLQGNLVFSRIVSETRVIENNVWLGMNSTVLKGVTIGEGTLVAANSLVEKSVPSNVLAAGIPARIIRELKPME
jgi:acetyltransferase-like isoleucine patch superfamily enzyme